VHCQRAYVGWGVQPGAALVVVCLAIVTLQPCSTAPAVAGCRLVGCSTVSGQTLLSLAMTRVLHHVHFSLGARSGLPCPVPVCGRRGRLAGAGSGSHCGVEFGLIRT
jgi:hypothetical protein